MEKKEKDEMVLRKSRPDRKLDSVCESSPARLRALKIVEAYVLNNFSPVRKDEE